ncbi:hypothetical protein AG1IA_09962 [Rhizoctonia solani AG-1 IA]|uniref:Uncharacterized protein n=1 Tax=Thanatephorus cucumeris (strain AG1-IA) TaxID=983506 RepID=L8WGU6_THACA|nr:hypothetical protein AG1IA_09962 [Rhizoctonia solani AG-1 IA]
MHLSDSSNPGMHSKTIYHNQIHSSCQTSHRPFPAPTTTMEELATVNSNEENVKLYTDGFGYGESAVGTFKVGRYRYVGLDATPKLIVAREITCAVYESKRRVPVGYIGKCAIDWIL